MTSISIRRLKVTVNGNPFLVEIEDLSTSPLIVKVNGQSYVVEIETDEGENTLVGKTPPALDMAFLPTPVSLAAPVSTSVPAKAPSPSVPAGAIAKTVKAPMPGHIIDILVKPGDEINTGQPLCLLEAMKMKNTIRSPRGGTIASIDVTLEQSVGYGDILVTFE
jgi:biotin carboxyl carrier protein